jgi:hypothetical protein
MQFYFSSQETCLFTKTLSLINSSLSLMNSSHQIIFGNEIEFGADKGLYVALPFWK